MVKDSNKHFISLGYFCSVALELERLGLRETSLPFDWLITQNFETVINMIDNHFCGFLDVDNMKQYSINRNHYCDEVLEISYFHEINRFQNFYKEIKNVKEKYNKRIKRFYNLICEPTIFVRYIKDEHELHYIINNYELIINCLRRFHYTNDIIFIINQEKKDLVINNAIGINIYFVAPDEKDTVARKFVDKCPQLYDLLTNPIFFNNERRKTNLLIYSQKMKKRNSRFEISLRKLQKSMQFVINRGEYVHNKIFFE